MSRKLTDSARISLASSCLFSSTLTFEDLHETVTVARATKPHRKATPIKGFLAEARIFPLPLDFTLVKSTSAPQYHKSDARQESLPYVCMPNKRALPRAASHLDACMADPRYGL
jgi:hypothetical protein